MKGLILFFLGVQTAQAGVVLLPAFMPERPEDKAHADRFHDSLLIELGAAGHTAIGQDALRSRVGSIVDTCAVTINCPAKLFAAWPAPVAIVGEVYADGDDMGVVTSVYSPDSSAPLRVFDQTVRVGEEWVGVESLLELVESLMPEEIPQEGVLALLEEDIADVEAVQAQGLAEEAQEASVVERVGRLEEEAPLSDAGILALLGLNEEEEGGDTFSSSNSGALFTEGPTALEESLEEVIPGDVETPPEDPIALEEAATDEPVAVEESIIVAEPENLVVDIINEPVALLDIPLADGLEDEPTAEEASLSAFPSRKELNLDPILYGSLRRSGLDAKSWLRTWRPHVNNGHLEVFGGVPYGDTIRSYDVRVALDATSLEQIGSSERDVFTEGVGYEFGAAIGYTPSPWIDLSALFSVMGGSKELTTGWAMVDGSFVQDSDIHVHTPSQSWQAIIEPRVRLYFLPVSWMKLYGLGGITVRFADSYKVPDLQVVDYPDRPSWTMVGWMVGGGLMIDPHDRIGIFVEAPWVHWFAPGDLYNEQTGVLPPILPQPVQKTGWVLRGNLGVQFRL
jgi:opacity protein-like surface antigen